MKRFHHHPDNFIIVDGEVPGDVRYLDTLDNFVADVLAAELTEYTGLPVGASEILYDQTTHRIGYPSGYADGPVPWELGDEYIDNVDLLVAAMETRLNPPPGTLEEKQEAKIDESLAERDETLAMGAPYSGQRFDVVSAAKKEEYNWLDMMVDKCLGPIGSCQITGGSNNPGVNKIDSFTVDGVELLDNPVDWVTSNNATAEALAAEINASQPIDPDDIAYQAIAYSGFVYVMLKAKDPFSTDPSALAGGEIVAVTVAGDVTVGSIKHMTAGPAPLENWPTDLTKIPVVKPINEFVEIPLETPHEGARFLGTISKWVMEVYQVHKNYTKAIPELTEEDLDLLDTETNYEPYRP